jgi:hypothetical protein
MTEILLLLILLTLLFGATGLWAIAMWVAGIAAVIFVLVMIIALAQLLFDAIGETLTAVIRFTRLDKLAALILAGCYYLVIGVAAAAIPAALVFMLIHAGWVAVLGLAYAIGGLAVFTAIVQWALNKFWKPKASYYPLGDPLDAAYKAHQEDLQRKGRL